MSTSVTNAECPCGAAIQIPILAQELSWRCLDCAMMNAYAKCNLPYPEPYTQRVTAFPVAKAPAELAFPSLPAGGMLVWGYSDAPTEFQKLHPTQQPDARWVVWVSASHPEASLARPKLLTTAKKYQRADGSVVFVGTP